MSPFRSRLFAAVSAAAFLPVSGAFADDTHHHHRHHHHDPDHDLPHAAEADALAAAAHDAAARAAASAPLGFSLTRGWTDPWVHSDFSPRGTPFVHLFGLEPAFLDRDLFVDFAFTEAEDEEESELAVELEYAQTRRLGIVVEAPLVSLNPDEGETEFGLGDAAIAPRALLVETDRFLLSANLEVAFPTGSESRGLGSGEVAIGPSVSTWLDLGNWFTLSTQVGTEHGTESGDSELSYAAALTYSFRGPVLFPGQAEDHAGHAHGHGASHFPPGLTSLILEYAGRTALSGDERDRSTGEVLFGLSHVLTESLEVRGAYQLPVGGTRDIDYGYVLSLIYHF
jgi:hypothetical protein